MSLTNNLKVLSALVTDFLVLNNPAVLVWFGLVQVDESEILNILTYYDLMGYLITFRNPQ